MTKKGDNFLISTFLSLVFHVAFIYHLVVISVAKKREVIEYVPVRLIAYPMAETGTGKLETKERKKIEKDLLRNNKLKKQEESKKIENKNGKGSKKEKSVVFEKNRKVREQQGKSEELVSTTSEKDRDTDSPSVSTLGANLAGFEDPNFKYDYYTSRMLAIIRSNWRKPAGVKSMEATVYFTITRDGRVVNLRLLKSSGSSSFDLAALRAIQASDPFPPLPGSYRENSLGVRVVFK